MKFNFPPLTGTAVIVGMAASEECTYGPLTKDEENAMELAWVIAALGKDKLSFDDLNRLAGVTWVQDYQEKHGLPLASMGLAITILQNFGYDVVKSAEAAPATTTPNDTKAAA